MTTFSIQVSDSQREFLESQAAQEGLMSPSDYIQELICAAVRRKGWATLEARIQEGVDSGDPVPVTDASWQEKKAKFIENHPQARLQ